MAIWMLLLFALPGSKPALEDHVDLIEVNHYHDSRGEHVFDQLIFYDWSSQKKRFQVRAWRLIKSESQWPRRRYPAQDFLVRWHDDGVLREVTSEARRETWTQYDPELIEREYLPQDQRIDLRPFCVPADGF
jgi:hypothetical protein